MAGFVWQWKGEVLSGDEQNLPFWVADAIKCGDLTYDKKWNLIIKNGWIRVKAGQSIVRDENGLSLKKRG